MKKTWSALLALGLILTVLPVAPPPAMAQTISITPTYENSSGTQIYQLNENGYHTVRYKLTASRNLTSALMVTVNPGFTFSGGETTATEGTCTGTYSNPTCTNDYGVIIGNTVPGNTSGNFAVTIAAGQKIGYTSIRIKVNDDRVTETREAIFFGTSDHSGYSISSGSPLRVIDQDNYVQLAASSTEFTEGSTDATNNVTVTGQLGGLTGGRFVSSTSSTFDAALSGRVIATGGNATAGSDYSFHDYVNNPYYRLRIPARDVSATATLSSSGTTYTDWRLIIKADNVAEPVETFQFQMSTFSGGGGATFVRRPVTVTIREDSNDTQVNFTPSVTSVDETDSDSTMNITASASFGTGVTSSQIAAVPITLSAVAGTASTPADYSITSINSVTIPANAASSTSDGSWTGFTVKGDDVVEGPETLTLRGSYTLLGNSYTLMKTLTINDDDDDIVLDISPAGVVEGDFVDEVTVTAYFTGSSSALTSATDVTVNFAGTATNGATPGSGPTGDFTLTTLGGATVTSPFTLSIPAGQTNDSQTFKISAPEDARAEGIERVAFTASAMVAGQAADIDDVEFNIYDADQAISIDIIDSGSRTITEIGEDGVQQALTLRLASPSGQNTAVSGIISYEAKGTTADSGSCTGMGPTLSCTGDYSSSGLGYEVTVSANRREDLSINITPFDDTVTEDHETIRFIFDTGDYRVNKFLTIIDADRDITVTLSDDRVTEPATGTENLTTTVTASLEGTTSTYSENLSMRVLIDDGTAASPADYTHLHGIADNPLYASIDVGDASDVAEDSAMSTNLVLTVAADDAAEVDETVRISLEEPEGFTIVPADVTIDDGDAQVTLTADTDDGETGEQKTLFENGGGDGSQVSVSAGFPTAITSSDIDTAMAVVLSVADGTAVFPGDYRYEPSPANEVTIPAGAVASSTAGTLRGLRLVNDSVVEGPETIEVRGTSSLVGDATADTLTIVDDDSDIVLSVSPAGVVERATAHNITVTAAFRGTTSALTDPTEVTVNIVSADVNGADLGMAAPTPSGDFWTNQQGNTFTITIPAGMTSATADFLLTARDDQITEAVPERVAITGSAMVGAPAMATAVAVQPALVTIFGPEQEITLTLHEAAVGDPTLAGVGEDGGEQTVRIKATVGETAAVSADTVVNLRPAAGSAAEGSCSGSGMSRVCTGDFTELADRYTLTIASGQTTGTADISITPHPDTVTEDVETIRFTGLADGYLVNPLDVPITDADRTIIVTLSAPSVSESTDTGAAPAVTQQMTATLSGESTTFSGRLLLHPLITAGTATHGSTGDYSHADISTAIINIPAGDLSATYDVGMLEIIGDDNAELNETVTFTVGDEAGWTITPAVMTITDDDGVLDLAVDTDSMAQNAQSTIAEDEGGDGSGITVTASFPNATGSSITSSTAITLDPEEKTVPVEGEAGTEDFDYNPPTANRITFAASATTAVAANLTGLSITDDDIVEGAETIKVIGSSHLPDAEFSLTVVDDDADIELSVSTEGVAERTDAYEVTVTAAFQGSASVLTTDTDVTITVDGAQTDGATRGAGADFTVAVEGAATNTFTITIPAGELRAAGTFEITARDDGTVETAENVAVTGSATVRGRAVTVAAAEFPIYDSGFLITLSLRDAASGGALLEKVGENDGPAAVAVWVEASVSTAVAADTDVTVTVGAAGSTAVVGSCTGEGETQTCANDYGRGADTVTVTIPATMTSGTARIAITPYNDRVTEDDEFIFFAGSATGYFTEDTKLEITDADRNIRPIMQSCTGSGEAEVCVENLEFLEDRVDTTTYSRKVTVTLGDGTGDNFVASESSTYSQALELYIRIRDGTHPAWKANSSGNEIDYRYRYNTQNRKIINIPAGSLSGSASTEIDIFQDDKGEWSEGLLLDTPPTGSSRFTAETIHPLIIDEDIIPVLRFLPSSAVEGGSPPGLGYTWDAEMTGLDTNDVPLKIIVTLSVGKDSPATGEAGSDDYDYDPPSTLTIPRGDTANLPDEYGVLSNFSITDDDIVEGPETLHMSGEVTTASISESDARFYGRLGTLALSRTSGTFTINDNDTAIALSVFPASVIEQAGAHTIEVTATFAGSSSVLTSDTDVTVTIAGGAGADAAALGTDFTTGGAGVTNNSFVVTIPAGEVSGAAAFELTAAADGSDEPSTPEKVSVSGTASVGGSVTVTGTEISIYDSDSPTITLSFTDDQASPAAVTAVGEDGGAKTIRVKAEASTAPTDLVELEVKVGAPGGSATLQSCTGSGEEEVCTGDYASDASADVSIGIAASATEGSSADIVITPRSDTITEDHETIRFTATSSTDDAYYVTVADLEITDADRTITVAVDDDEMRELQGTGPTAVEATYQRRVTAALSGETSTLRDPLNMRVLLTGGTATAVTDFYHLHDVPNDYRYVNIAAGSLSASADIAVTVLSDHVAEDEETINVSLDAPTGFTVNGDDLNIIDEVDTAVVLRVDSDAVMSGYQGFVSEDVGGDGSDIRVWAGFPESVTSSTISSTTSVELTVDEKTSPATGEAGNADVDYAPAPPNTVTIPAEAIISATPATLRGLTVVDDGLVEGTEILQLGGISTRPVSGSLTIIDDDAELVLSAAPTAVVEREDFHPIGVTASFAGSYSLLTEATLVTVTITGGETNPATRGMDSDYVLSGAGVFGNRFTLTIPAGGTRADGSFRLTARPDAMVEDAETVNVTGWARVRGRQVTDSQEITILDSGVTLSLSDSGGNPLVALAEDSGSSAVRVTAQLPTGVVAPAGGLIVGLNAAGGTAVLDADGGAFAAGEDFQASYPSGTNPPPGFSLGVTIPAGASSGTGQFTINISDDSVAEGARAETLLVQGGGVTVGDANLTVLDAVLGITDDDSEITLSFGDTSASEEDGNAGDAVVTARFGDATASAINRSVVVELSFAVGGGAEAADFSAPNPDLTVSIPALSTSGEQALTALTITNDDIAELTENLNVTGTLDGYVVHGTVLPIADDESVVILSIPSDAAVSEGGDGSAVSVSAAFQANTQSTDIGANTVITLSAADGTAASPDDYAYTAPDPAEQVIILNGDTSSSTSGSLSGLAVENDDVTEGTETVMITGSSHLGKATPVDLPITDADTGLELTLSPVRVVEQAGAQEVTVTAGFAGVDSSTRSEATTVQVTVAGGQGDDGANLGSGAEDDFTVGGAGVANNQFNIVIPARQLEADGAFEVTVADDGNTEGTEKAAVSAAAQVDGTSETASAELDVLDNGVRLSLSDPTDGTAVTALGEGSGTSTVRVTAELPNNAPHTVVVGLEVAGGTATLDADAAPFAEGDDFRVSYPAKPAGAPAEYPLGIRIAVGTNTGYADITVVVNEDDRVEGPAAETITISGGSVTVGGQSVAVFEENLGITDNDLTINLTITGTARESDGNGGGAQIAAAFAAAHSDLDAALDVGLTFTAAPGTETLDFTAPDPAVSLSIPAGAVSSSNTALTALGFTDDDIAEITETITVGGEAAGYTVGEASLPIIDDESVVVLSIPSEAAVSEGGDGSGVAVSAAFQTGTQSSDISADVVVTLSAADGTAVSPADYSYAAPDPADRVVIPAGDLQSSVVGSLSGLTVADDAVTEGPETITVRGSSSLGPAAVGASLPVTDADTGIELSVSPAEVPERPGPQTVTVTASFAGAASSTRTALTPVTVTIAGGDGADGATLGPAPSGDFTTGGPGVTGDVFVINIPAGRTSAVGTFEITARLDDDNAEGTEKVKVTGAATVDGTSVTHSATFDIVNGVVLTLTDPVSGTAVTGFGEDAGSKTVRVTATLPGNAASEVVVGVNVTGVTAVLDADAAPFAAGEDLRVVYPSLADGTPEGHSLGIVVPSGSASGYADLELVINDDTAAEGVVSETLSVGGENITVEGESLPVTSVSLDIDDNDSVIELSVTGAAVESVGNAGGATVTAAFAGAASSDIPTATEVTLDFAPGSGTEDADFTDPGSSLTVTIPAGAVSVSRVLSALAITDDSIAERAETITVDGTAAPYTVRATSLSITDDESVVTLSYAATSDASVTEGGDGSGVLVSAAFDPGTTSTDIGAATVITLKIEDGTATSPADYSHTPGSDTVSIPDGSTSSSTPGTLAGLSIKDDEVTEEAETLSVTGTSSLGPDTVNKLTLGATDADTGIEISVDKLQVGERTNPHVVTVTAAYAGVSSSTRTSALTVTVVVASGDGADGAVLGAASTPGPGDDFWTDQTNHTFTIEIPAGDVSATGTFNLTAHRDSDDSEGAEKVKLTASATVDGNAVSHTTNMSIVNGIVVTVTDPVTGDPVTDLAEGSGTTTVRVTAVIPEAPTAETVVGLNFAGGTATLDGDGAPFAVGEDLRVVYPSLPAGTPAGHSLGVVVAAGSATGYADVDITINDDARAEGLDAETFTVSGGAVTVSGESYNVLSAELSVSDNDSVIALSVSGTADESAGNAGGATVTAAYKGATHSDIASAVAVSLTFAVGPGAEAADFDDSASITITIAAGDVSDSEALTALPVTDDVIAEEPETITVGGGTDGSYTVEGVGLTITDDDAVLELSLASGDEVSEGGDGSGVSVTASYPTRVTSSDISTPTVVTLSVTDGTAGSADYAYGTADTVTIPAMAISSGSSPGNLDGLTIQDDEVTEGPETVRVGGMSPALGTASAVDLTVVDADTGVTLTVDRGTVVEDDDGQTITVTAAFTGVVSSTRSAATTVTVTAQDGDAAMDEATLGASAADGDYWTDQTNHTFTIEIPAAAVSASGSFLFTAWEDAADETPEPAELSGSVTVDGNTIEPEAVITIVDEGVILSFANPSDGTTFEGLEEDDGSTEVRVTATLPTTANSEVVVGLNIVGGAGGAVLDADGSDFAPGEDFQVSYPSGSPPDGHLLGIVIPVGVLFASAVVTILPNDDEVAEGPTPESIAVRGADADVDGSPLPVADGALTITDDDSTITLQVNGAAEEADGNAGDVLVTALFADATSSAITTDTVITLTVTPGENAEEADITSQGTITVAIPAMSVISPRVDLSGVVLDDDSDVEGTESLNLEGDSGDFEIDPASFEIIDDDSVVVLTFSVPSVAEGGHGSTVNVTARFDADQTTTTTEITSDTAITLSVSDGSAGSDDYTYSGSNTVTILAGAVASTQPGTLAGLEIRGDDITEGTETILVGGDAPWGVAPALLNVTDDERGISLRVTPETVAERTDAHTVTVIASFTGAEASTRRDPVSVTVTIAPGDADGATLGSEGPPPSGDFWTDQTNNTFTIDIPAGAVSHSGTFQLTARDDGDSESPEKVKVSGSATVDSFVSNISDQELTIFSGAGITLSFTNPDTNDPITALTEDGDESPIRVRVTAALPSGTLSPAGGATVGLNVEGGTAVMGSGSAWQAGEDFRVIYPDGDSPPEGHALGIFISEGDSSASAVLEFLVNDDGVAEDSETLLVTGASVAVGPNSYPVLGAGLEITDADLAPTDIDITLSDSSGVPLSEVAEDGGTIRVRVQASYRGDSVLPRAVAVPLGIGKAGDDGAESGTDYQAVTNPPEVVIPAYAASGAAEFDLVFATRWNDYRPEGPETLTVVGDPEGLSSFTVGEAALKIVDDDAAITLTLLDENGAEISEVAEGEQTQITVQASYPPAVTLDDPQTVTISIGAADDGPTPGTDFETVDDISLTIPGGETEDTEDFSLNVSGTHDDNRYEGDETLQVTGELPGFTVAPAQITIKDDETRPAGIELSPSSATMAEGAIRTITVRFPTGSDPLDADVAVTLTTTGVATVGNDYTLSATEVTIPAGAVEARFTITITNDTQREPIERLTITATAEGFGSATAQITIPIDSNDEPPPPPQNPPGNGGNGGAPPPSGGGGNGGGGGGGGGGAPPPSGGGGGGGGGGAPPPPPPPAEPVTPPPPAEPACQGRFCDEDGSVHQANIERIAEWQITLGCDAEDPTKFCPSAQITRRQMAAFLYRAVSQRWTIETPQGVEITDVPEDAWYRGFADWVVSIGAFAAPDGVFNPGGVVTRADMAVMMIAAFPHIEAVEEPEGLFNDVANVAPAVVLAVEGMYHSGVTKGCTTTPLNYCPDKPVTRAQMASFFVRAIDLVPAPTPPPEPS